jgi:hypothetical protein
MPYNPLIIVAKAENGFPYPIVELSDLPRVAIGIACNKYQHTPPWRSLWSLLWNGGSVMTSSGALTDQNRNFIVKWFLEETDLEWLFFVDDDVELPQGTLIHLYSAAKHYNASVIGGVYYRRSPPFNPLIFLQEGTGWYKALLPGQDYHRGDILEVDGIGMGCTLIHRSVFEAIIDSFFLFRRPNRSYGFGPYGEVVVHEDDDPPLPGIHVYKDRALYVMPIIPTKPDRLEEHEQLPFFALEYGRTEDFYFCELVRMCGLRILAHTGIECSHWGESPVDYNTFKMFLQMNQAHENPNISDDHQHRADGG